MSKDKEYDVGYGKPPAEGQFKKGQSGNPKGRPKKDNSLESMLEKILSEKVTTTVGGKKCKRTKLEILLTQQANKAVMGNDKAFQQLSKLIMQVNTKRLIEKESEPLPWHDDD